MPSVAELATLIRQKASAAQRFMVGISGPPGSGKSTLSEALHNALPSSIVVPMDGFHFDDIILNARGHRPRKGAPFTFDVAGFEVLLKRIKAREPDIAIPVFDRHMELSRNAADIVSADAKYILVEGNYLLLKQSPWDRLKPLFDFTIFIDVPKPELELRLMGRITAHGHDEAYAKNWIASNDMLNIETVLGDSATADMVVWGGP
jgi:pantothenate kinase